MSTPTVAILHPGRMGTAIARQIDSASTKLWCPQGRSPATHHRANGAGLEPLGLNELAAASDIVISLVPPAAAEDTAHALLAEGFTGLYVEANAIRPHRAHALAEMTRKAGADFVDACVIGPPPAPNTQTTRFYLAGDRQLCNQVTALLPTGAPQIHYLGAEDGQASALKTAQGIAQKATRIVSILAHALATNYGVTDELASLTSTWPHPASEPEKFPSVAARAWRWESEFHDISQALHEAGLPPGITTEIITLLRKWENLKDDDNTGLDEVISQMIDIGNSNP
ncbi:NAD(P)-dependent oxidoreductase [Allosalinactinospora lopnorensis]|uniref:NAD(P)-dependent oxidoreductase n=1 Tax=Allosalinactinospora lopnorensis TaxID=1352348 RepID=UPI0009E2662F|nr:DUF1932 domain-containing protein [Allosalinactinospora lopnorensis]